jgi:hypothetical protein
MTISGNYPTPVYVNGYQCNNCAQVAEAKKDINPADPKAGPGGVDANTPANQTSPAVIFGGSLANAKSASNQAPFPPNTSQGAQVSSTPGLGALLNISV